MKEKFIYQKANYKKEGNPNYKGGKEVPCIFCGKLVYRGPSDLKKRKNIFCSPKCHDDFRRKPKLNVEVQPKPKGEKHYNWSGPKYCEFCGIELISGKERGKGRCSSVECDREAKERQIKNRSDWKGDDIVSKCAYCEKEIRFRPGHFKKYCSHECMHLGRRNRVTLNCQHCQKEFIVAFQRLRDASPQFCSLHCYRASNLRTTLEIKIGIAFNDLGLKFVDEYRPKGTRRIFDFYLYELNILVEADGDFWHYSQWASERGIPKRDKDKEQWAISQGFKVMRIKGSDVDKFGADRLIKNYLGI